MNAERRDEHGSIVHVQSRVDGLVWIDGVIHIRATSRWLGDDGTEHTVRRSDVESADNWATSLFSVRERTTGTAHDLPTTSTAELVPVTGHADHVAVRVHAEARVDPRAIWPGADRGTWDFCVGHSARQGTHRVEVGDDAAARPAIVDDVPYVAFRNDDGTLSLASHAEALALVDAARPRTAGVRVDTTTNDGGRKKVDVAVALDGIRVFPTSGERTVAQGAAELVAPVDLSTRRTLLERLRRAEAPAPVPGSFTVTAHGEDVTLHVTAAATPGLWQIELTDRGHRSALRVLVRIRKNGSAKVLAATPAAEDVSAASAAPPRVSVVVPVHNAQDTVEEAIRSVFDQTLPAEQIEIVAVDDGSSDDSLAILRRLERGRHRMRVFTQPASGTAAAPRNAGIDAATGRHIFFLDADDLLTPTSLEKMADAADALEADVVLGKMQGFANRKRFPRRVFFHPSVDADMVTNHLMHALGPTKLFRTEHLKERGIRFPSGLLHGEDLPFTAEAEFTARRIVILTDAVYYLVRGHEPRNVKQKEPLIDIKLRKTRLLTGLVERHTEPGARRDALLKRPFSEASLEGAFRREYLALDAPAQSDLVNRVADEFAHLWTPGLRAHLKPPARPLFDLVFQRDPANVAALVRHAKGKMYRLPVVADQDGLFLDAPPSVVDALGREALRSDTPDVTHVLTGLTASGARVTVSGHVRPLTASSLPNAFPLPTGIHAEWRLREPSGATDTEVVKADAAVLGTTRVAPKQIAVSYSIETDAHQLPDTGSWDLWVTPVWNGQAGTPERFSGACDRSVGTDAIALDGSSAVLYRTAKAGHVSIDADGTDHPVPAVRLEALQLDADGRPEAVLRLASDAPAPRVYAYVDSTEGRAARHRLPWRRLDDELLAARLPAPFTISTLPMTLAVAVRGVLAPVDSERSFEAGSEEVRAEAVPGVPDRAAARAAMTIRVVRTSPSDAPALGTAAPSSPEREAGRPIRLWWWRWRYPNELNFGDEVTAPLLERLTGRRVVWTPPDEAEIVGAGSVLRTAMRVRADGKPAVWGAGTIQPLEREVPADFVPHAVRGRLSLQCLSPAARSSAVLGDPGILADSLVDGPVSKKYALGVVPHYKDAQDPIIRAIAAMPGVRRIDVAWTPEEVAREIASCQVVLSSSMHGLIFADALGVPNAQLRVSDKLVGGDFKFRDYSSAFGSDRYQPPLTPTDVSGLDLSGLVDLVESRFRPPTGIEKLKRGLIDSLPV